MGPVRGWTADSRLASGILPTRGEICAPRRARPMTVCSGQRSRLRQFRARRRPSAGSRPMAITRSDRAPRIVLADQPPGSNRRERHPSLGIEHRENS